MIFRIPSPAQANEADFRRLEFRQQVAFGTTRRSTATTMLGVLVSMPMAMVSAESSGTLTANSGRLATRC
ncbi:alpha-hydroxy-acid oxidizing protein [Pseudomonas graminis]|uniref:alpha-hydroxy-acid oxidizing protein n=1 Tax=Pseudomonas graminis TaxID=158627 RepID=UPI00234B5CA1|nr:alpha-hydroxy-acid oxidizing protein [Pseudomonas graminis]MDC6378970.1 alpha-hydroxy-acid oxidizing protein [Pseudomonas graminis]